MPGSTTLHAHTFDGRAFTRDQLNMLLIELKYVHAGSNSAALSAARLVTRATSEHLELPVSRAEEAALRRALEGIRLKRHGLSPALSQLRASLQAEE